MQVGFLLAAHGSVDRYLGELADLMGAEREADIHFASALAMDEAAGMPVWLAHTHAAYGRVARGAEPSADIERAVTHLGAGLAAAERIGLPHVVADGAGELAARCRPTAPARTDSSGLTEREIEVLRLVAQGRSNREIGARLHISQHTAANHIRSILMKTACANRTEAAAWALRNDLTRGQ